MGRDVSGDRGLQAEITSPWRPARTVAVVLAGGTGSRVGLGIPKQLLKIAGKSIIEHTIAVFEAAPEIDEIMILMTPGYVDQVSHIVEKANFHKVTQIVEGGATRSETTQIALDLIGSDDCNILFHDAVRPLLSHRIVRECINALWSHAAVDVAIPSADTVVVVDENDFITDIPVRSRLRRGQTPQAFRSGTIREAYRRAGEDPEFSATDDCGVVLRYLPDVPIKVILGAEDNIKITHPVDVHLADKLFQLAAETEPRKLHDRSYTEALSGRTLVVFGGSYGIGHELAEFARSYGAQVFSYSRSTTGTHVERATDVEAALQEAFDKTGRIDYVVVTAGVLYKGPLADADEDAIEQAVRVNYLAPITVARQSLPYLRQTRGQLLLFTSSSYTRGRGDYAVYSSSKAAVVNLTQALADEWSEESVRVNCINPERTATPMRTQAFGEEPPHTLLQADAVALASIDVLISDLTGQVIDVRRAPDEQVDVPPESLPGSAAEATPTAPQPRQKPSATPTMSPSSIL
ncbi:MAG TPA: bifunctional cytidylyltransferase/SDR family oxidoreductase [Micromonospora sp.]|nr:bifunctional cytidylyltransferase/SDR family oxidoreductase [Micromonospora sp.]